MSAPPTHDCEICRRLGRKECGYHQFKKQCLSRFSGCSAFEDTFAQTRSSMERRPFAEQQPQIRVVTPEKIVQRPVTFQYPNSQPQPSRVVTSHIPFSVPQSKLFATPPKTVPLQPMQPIFSPPRPISENHSHIVRM
jgi:hypothetical protein